MEGLHELIFSEIWSGACKSSPVGVLGLALCSLALSSALGQCCSQSHLIPSTKDQVTQGLFFLFTRVRCFQAWTRFVVGAQ